MRTLILLIASLIQLPVFAAIPGSPVDNTHTLTMRFANISEIPKACGYIHLANGTLAVMKNRDFNDVGIYPSCSIFSDRGVEKIDGEFYRTKFE